MSSIMELAARIKELRELSGMDISSLATEAGVTPAQYEAYESGAVDIPASFLLFLAGKFEVELATILTGEEPRLRRYSLTRKGRGVGTDRRKEYRYHNLAYNFQNKRAEPFLVSVDPAKEGAPISLNTHAGQEFDYVLEGRMRIQIDGSTLELGEGDCVYYDSTAPHGMQAIGDQPCRFLAIIFEKERA